MFMTGQPNLNQSLKRKQRLFLLYLPPLPCQVFSQLVAGANAVKSTMNSSFMPRLFKTVVAATAAIMSPSVPVPALTGSIESKDVPFSTFDPVDEAITWLGDTGAGRTTGCVKQVPLDCVGDA